MTTNTLSPLAAPRTDTGRIADVAGKLVPLAVCMLVLARFLPGQAIDYHETLDNGWARAISFAAAHAMVFGRDIVFNYGPYGVLATGVYEPGLRGMMIAGGLLLGMAFAAGLVALRRPFLSLLLALALPLVWSFDSLVFAMPMAAMLLCANSQTGSAASRWVLLAVLPLLPALGLLPLIKSSYLGVALPALAALSVLLWQTGARRLATAAPVVSAASLVLLWCTAGQPVAALPAFFAGALQIIAGHNASMASDGPALYAALIALTGVVFLALQAWGARALPRPKALILCGGSAIMLFVAFKAGFVRQDRVHEIITIAAAGLLFIILAHWLAARILVAASTALGLALIVTAAGSDWMHTVLHAPADKIRADAVLLADPAALATNYQVAMAGLGGLPWKISGSADIYSTGQLRLFAAGADWSPRPMFQSYSAYTPALAAANAAHLRGPQAPANIFFRVEPIDGRLPALADGPSWPGLLLGYDPAGYDAGTDLLWLKRAAHVATPDPRIVLPPQAAIMGRQVSLPPAGAAIWAQIDTAPTLAGRAVAALWHAPALQIRLDFAGRPSRVFDLPPGMARAGFLLSPFVAATLDFLRLRAVSGAAPNLPPAPTAVTIMAAPGGSWAWQSGYVLKLQTAGLRAPAPRHCHFRPRRWPGA